MHKTTISFIFLIIALTFIFLVFAGNLPYIGFPLNLIVWIIQILIPVLALLYAIQARKFNESKILSSLFAILSGIVIIADIFITVMIYGLQGFH